MGTAHTSVGVRALVKSVVGGLKAWQQPEAATEGLGGTYFFLNEIGKKTAIVKPCDEEPLAPNNPKVAITLNYIINLGKTQQLPPNIINASCEIQFLGFLECMRGHS